jgi:predicted transcriptional regulator
MHWQKQLLGVSTKKPASKRPVQQGIAAAECGEFVSDEEVWTNIERILKS